MHFLVFYNSTHSKIDGTWFYYLVITYFELIFVLLSYPPVIYLLIQLFRHRLFHNNLQNSVKCVIIEYLIQLSSRCLQILLIFNSKEDEDAFYYSSLIRCTCYFFVSFSLPSFVAERCCASYFLSDYEKKDRSYIFIGIMTFLISCSIYLSFSYHQVEKTTILHVSMLLINILSSIVIIFLEKYNYKRLDDSSNLRKSHRDYSLNERFQISENIRVCEFMKTIINVVSIFNLLSSISAGMDNFDLTKSQLNLVATFFNICVLTYGSLVISLFFYLTPAFRKEILLIYSKIQSKVHILPECVEKPKSHKPDGIEVDSYFVQLQNQWL